VPAADAHRPTLPSTGASLYRARPLRARRLLTRLIILQDGLQPHGLTSCSPQRVLGTAPLIAR
jgi:hypothetical protein